MPTTQRPFFYNFLAAFRAHSAVKAAPTTSPGPASATAALSTQATNASSSIAQSALNATTSPPSPPTSPHPAGPRAITSSSPHKTPSSLVSAFSPPNHSQHHTSRHHTRQPSNSAGSRGPGPALGNGAGARRGSDSSSDSGFRDTLGGERWFIGGRTAQGEEKFYRLGMVRRDRSGDRSSLDRMSL